MSRWSKALSGGLLLTLLLQFCGFAGNCEAIRNGVVRVHILANSDSEEDQQLKLKVRDAVTAAGENLLDGTEDIAAAREKLQAALPTLCAAAQQCVYDNGYAYEVNGEVTHMYFTTRTYDSGTFPAGYYDAVRFTIGEGAGRNWWCVMYPPLCVSAAADPDTLTNTFTHAQTDIIEHSGRYRVRFKIVEWWERLMACFR